MMSFLRVLIIKGVDVNKKIKDDTIRKLIIYSLKTGINSDAKTIRDDSSICIFIN